MHIRTAKAIMRLVGELREQLLSGAPNDGCYLRDAVARVNSLLLPLGAIGITGDTLHLVKLCSVDSFVPLELEFAADVTWHKTLDGVELGRDRVGYCATAQHQVLG